MSTSPTNTSYPIVTALTQPSTNSQKNNDIISGDASPPRSGHVPAIWGYVRMSTNKQEKSPDIQANLIRKYAGTLDGFFAGCRLDAATSGRKTKFLDRKEARKLMRDMLPGDHLIIWKIDRLGRNTIDICSVLDHLVRMKINVYVLNFAGGRLDLTTATGRAFVGMLAVFAELESGLISERTKEGMEYLKENNLVCNGRPKYGHHKVVIKETIGMKKPQKRWEKHEGECAAIKEIYARRLAGETIHSIYNDFRARKIKTAEGKPWASRPYYKNSSQVKRFYRVCEWYRDLLAEGGSL